MTRVLVLYQTMVNLSTNYLTLNGYQVGGHGSVGGAGHLAAVMLQHARRHATPDLGGIYTVVQRL